MHPNQEKPSLEHFSISPRSSYMWRECKDIFKQKNLKYYCFLFLDLECFILAKPFLLVGHHLHDLLVPHLLDHIGVREDVTEKKLLFFWAMGGGPVQILFDFFASAFHFLTGSTSVDVGNKGGSSHKGEYLKIHGKCTF